MDHSNPIRRDLHAEITNQLIAAIEADPGRPTLPWRKSGGPLHTSAGPLVETQFASGECASPAAPQLMK
jgi:hypothetical protein